MLSSANEPVVTVYQAARSSAQQVVGSRKNYHYFRAADILALMDIYEVDSWDRGRVLRGVTILQDEANRMRPMRPKKKRRPGR